LNRGRRPRSVTLLDICATTAAMYPDAPALADSSVELTYAQLEALVAETAECLRAAGAGAGDRIPSGCADLYVSILAALSVGAAYVPVDFDDSQERAEIVWAHAGVDVIISTGRKVTGSGTGSARRPEPDDDAWIIFTSGSTGTPKGVAITHRSAAAFVNAEARLFCQDEPLGPGDRVLAALSVAFDASCEEMWLAWRHGACLVAALRDKVRSGADFGEWIVSHGVTVVSTVPTLAALWPSLDGVRLLILGGEACPPELVTRVAAPGREVWNTYGPTEATVVACAARLVPDEPVRIGLPLDGWELAVVGPDGNPVPAGEVGELVIAGVGLGRYLDPVHDAERYTPLLGWDRAYRTGDLVRNDPAGLVFVGRADDQVKISGRRVELGEIDAALSALPGVVASAATVHNGLLVGYVVADAFDPIEARLTLAVRLPAGLVPRLVELPSLPMKTSGKVDRGALPWPVVGESVSYETETETWLASQWAEVLGVQAGRTDDFFDLGGGSLAAAKLVSSLRQRFPTAAVPDVYQHPTLPALAGYLDELLEHEPGHRIVVPTPRRSGAIQALVQLSLATVTGVKWVLALLVLDDLMDLVDPEPWAPATSWWILLGVWLLLVSPIGKLGIVLGASRLLRKGIRPGEYPRGGRVHLRLWTLERIAVAFSVAGFAGTHWAARYAKALGCQVGSNVDLHAMPPVTGLATFGDQCTVEPEADLAGWWLDGDVLHVGEITIGTDARVGARSTLLPGAKVLDGAEILPGSCVTATETPVYNIDWPEPRRDRARGWNLAYTASMLGLSALPVLVSIPWMLLGYQFVRDDVTLGDALGHLLIITPLATVAAVVCYAVIVVLLVRLAGLGIKAGMHPARGRVAWCVWLTDRLVRSARVTLSRCTRAWRHRPGCGLWERRSAGAWRRPLWSHCLG
jgi:amino acid adenylation domain-containing protein